MYRSHVVGFQEALIRPTMAFSILVLYVKRICNTIDGSTAWWKHPSSRRGDSAVPGISCRPIVVISVKQTEPS